MDLEKISKEDLPELRNRKTKRVLDEINEKLTFKEYSLMIAIKRCESPIEELMAINLIEGIYDQDWLYREIKPDARLNLLSQTKIMANSKEYRVDFLIESTIDGKACCFAVECDGHDFHEKTKEQAARDKARDRDLQSVGCPVIRFTGSEIWEDPKKCANEAYDIVFSATGMKRIFDGQAESMENDI